MNDSTINGNGHHGGLRSVLELACTETGYGLGDLTVLAGQNDPFRVDTPARHRDGEWLAMQAERLGLGERRIHLRGLHYMLVSGQVVKPDGKPYTNTDPDWCWLVGNPAKAARWLGYLPFEQVTDARNSEPVIRRYEAREPASFVTVGAEIEIPEADDLEPHVVVEAFEGVQPYKLVLFGEKTSLDDVLASVAAIYHADVYLPAGEISDTLLYRMAATGAEDGRPMVVFTLSDADPAGWQMPISVARKLQAFRAFRFPGLDFQVRRVALTPEQVGAHGLPSTPLKASERRADRWRERMGVEQTEIDALAALNPRLLRRIVREAMAPFFDATLDRRVNEARADWLKRAQAALNDQLDGERLERLRDDAVGKLDTLRDELEAVNEALRAETGDDFDLPDIDVPKARIEAQADGLPLIDSNWTWTKQSRRLIAAKGYEVAG